MKWAIALLFVIPAIAGCLSDDHDDAPSMARGTERGDAAALLAAAPSVAGTPAAPIDGGVAVELSNVDMPFEETLSVPHGATMIRFIADPGADATISVAMSNDETGRRRCNQQSVTGYADGFLGARSCSSLTVLDPPGTTWSLRASGPATADIRVEFLHIEPDGVVAQLDLDALSQADHNIRPTQYGHFPSHDGVELWVEWTLPDGEGPFPTVIAASPYNGQAGRLGNSGTGDQAAGETPAMWTYWTQDWAKRGYAAVNVDVRGFGKSEGCVEVWGVNEQLDQKWIVDWVRDQPWSDSHMGFYGQSYVGTTPVAAAVQAPEGLDAIIAVAPVIDAYHDWHYGGVPNGESGLSPAAYQAAVDALGAFWLAEDPTRVGDVTQLLQYATQGICDIDLAVGANDPRAIHGAFFDERDFGARAADVTAAVMFTQGFEDANVKSAMIPDWFNDITAPKLGVFGHWLHQHPARMDQEVLFVGWMDQYVKGRDIGFDRVQGALVSADGDWHRLTDSWPTIGLDTIDVPLTTGQILLHGVPTDLVGGPAISALTTTHEVEATAGLSAPYAVATGSLVGANGMLYAELWDGDTLITYGMRNLGLDDTYESFAPPTSFNVTIPFRPTEVVVDEGATLRLVMRGVQLGEAVGTAQPLPGVVDLTGGSLVLPMVPLADYEPMPITALP